MNNCWQLQQLAEPFKMSNGSKWEACWERINNEYIIGVIPSNGNDNGMMFALGNLYFN